MAISVSSQRVALANLFSNGDDGLVNDIKRLKTAELLKSEESSNGLFDYYVNDETKDAFSRLGIQLSVHCYRPHPHPISKMIENHILYNIIPPLLTGPTLFVSLRETKVLHLISSAKKKPINDYVVYNRRIHSKDLLRYQNPYRELTSYHMETLQRVSKNATIAFIHDEVHYWSLRDFQLFLGNLNSVDKVLYTVIYPVELTANIDHSLKPEYYEFEKHDDFFTWYPDGNTQGAYKQPINDWVLKTRKTLDSNQRTWTLTKLETFGSHHLFLCSLGSLATETSYKFNDFSLMHDTRFVKTRRGKRNPPRLRHEVIKNVLLYLLALKKPDAQSAIAKLRQMSPKNLHPDEALFLAEMTKCLQSTKMYDAMGLFDLKEYIWNTMTGVFGSKFQFILNRKEFNLQSMEVFIRSVKAPVIQVEREFRDYIPELPTRTAKLGLNEWKMTDFNGEDVSTILAEGLAYERDTQPYSLNPAIKEVTGLDLFLEKLLLMKRVTKGNDINEDIFLEKPEFIFRHIASTFIKINRRHLLSTKLLCAPPLNPVRKYREGIISKDELVSILEKEDKPERGEKNEFLKTAVDFKADNQGEQLIEGETSSDESVDHADEVVEVEDSIKEILKKRSNLCTLELISKHLGISDLQAISLVNGAVPKVMKEFSLGGLTLKSFLDVLRALKVGLKLITERGYLESQGQFKQMEAIIENGHISETTSIVGSQSTKEALLSMTHVKECFVQLEERRAMALMESFSKGCTGIVTGKFQVNLKPGKIIEPSFYSCFGFAGSGKTSTLMSILKGYLNSQRVIIISPRKNLAGDWASELKDQTNIAVYTYENAIKAKNKGETDLTIFDEIGLFPPNYLDLYFSLHRSKFALLTGDHLQGCYYSADDRFLLAEDYKPIYSRVMGEVPYLAFSHRLPSGKKSFFSLKRYGNTEGGLVPVLWDKGEKLEYYTDLLKEDISWSDLASRQLKRGKPTHNQSLPYLFNGSIVKKGDGILVCSRRRKDDIDGSMTIGESQGLTFKHSHLILDQDANKISDESLMVALTRSRSYCFVHIRPQDVKYFESHASSTLLRNLIRGEPIGETYIKDKAKELGLEVTIIREQERIGTTEDLETRLDGDPYLKTLLSLLEIPEIEEPHAPEVEIPLGDRTHLPLSTYMNHIDPYEVKERFDREAHTIYGVTDQIDELGYKNEPENPCTHKNLYLRHKSSDDATFLMSVRKRLKFCDYERNRRNYVRAEPIGKQIFEIFVDRMKLSSPTYLPSLEISENEFMRKRLEKSSKMIEMHSLRSDPDWSPTDLLIFLKNQTCTKLEKRGIDAKAGQTIACFSHSVLCRFGPILRQTEKAVRAQLKPNIMVYSQKNYDDLDNWCRQYVFEKIGTDSDYEAFDRSQDEIILSFEVNLLRMFLWPEDLIREYEDIKLMMGCKLGNLAVMRFTGEFGTFFFNTVCNMAFSVMKYEIDEDTPICYAGDDMYSPGILRVSKKHDDILKKLSLKAKVHISESPLFCGWRMTPYGIIKDPVLLYDRWMIAKGKGELNLCGISYAIEASYGYKLCSYLDEVDVDIETFQSLIREIVLIKHSFPKFLRDRFSDLDDEPHSDEEELPLTFTGNLNNIGETDNFS